MKLWNEKNPYPCLDELRMADGGTLPNGEMYLVYNFKTEHDRDTLCVAVGKDSLERVYAIKKGHEEPQVYNDFYGSQWSYPYAVVDGDKLYVAHNQNKENAMISVIPLSSLGA